MLLSAEDARVLGVLIEKQLTTPQQYPLTLAALVTGCNQSTNRDPVVAYDEAVVNAAIHELKQLRLARSVLPSHGRSVTRYRHVVDETLALDERQCSLFAVLLLRGPQTLGELRARTERMADFSGLDDVDEELHFLAGRQEALAVNVGRQPGQKEERWACPLFDADTVRAVPTPTQEDTAPEATPVDQAAPEPGPAPEPSPAHEDVPHGATTDTLDDIRATLASLRNEVSDLSLDLRTLRERLGD
jgi:hypothetical protein